MAIFGRDAAKLQAVVDARGAPERMMAVAGDVRDTD